MTPAKCPSFLLQHIGSTVHHESPPVLVSVVAATPFVPEVKEVGHRFGWGSYEVRGTGGRLATEERCHSSAQRCRCRYYWRFEPLQN